MRKLRHIVIVAVASALVGCAAGPRQPTASQEANQQWNATRASVLLTLAKDQYKNGAFDKCKQTIAEATRLDPKNDQIAVLSAQLAIEQGDMEIAERQLAAARQENPKNAQAFYLSGVVYQRWAQPQQAYEMYSQALALEPTQLPYLMARAEMLVTMDRSPEALSLLQANVAQFENSAVLCDAVGMLLTQQHRDAEAIDMLQRATILAPEDNSIREHYALELAHAGQYAAAIDQFHRLLAPPADPYGLLKESSDTPKADDYANRADLWLALGECQMQTHDLHSARETFETAVTLDNSNAAAWRSLGKAALTDNDLKRAAECADRALALNNQDQETLLFCGYVDLKSNKPEKAFTHFAAASKLDPTDTLSLCMMGYAMQRMNKPQQAMEYYSQALKIAPNDDLAKTLMDDAQKKL